MKWIKQMKHEAWITLHILASESMWIDIRRGIFAIMQLLIRVLVLITFPISTPLFAWASIRQERRMAEYEAKARERLRADIHRNGKL